jgi:chromosome segregation ATPase
MKIKKIKIEGFGIFHKLTEFQFDTEKINVIYGENEAGKTTILKAIIATIFGVDKSNWSDVKSFKSAKKYFAEIEFTDKKSDYRLTREFENNSVNFRIGLNNEEAFKNVNVIFQKSIESKIDKEIQHILTGAVGTNYKTVLEKWTKEYFHLTKMTGWKNFQNRRRDKEIEILEKELKELQDKKDQAIGNSMKNNQLDTKIENLEKELNTLDKNVKDNKEAHDIAREYIELVKQKKDHEEKILILNEAIEKYSKLKKEQLEKKNIIESQYAELIDVKDEDIGIIKEVNSLQNDLSSSKTDLNRIEGSKDFTPVKKIILGINGLIISFLMLIGRYMFHKPVLLWISIGFGLLSLVYLIYALMEKAKTSSEYTLQKNDRSTRINELQLKLQLLKEKISHLSHLQKREGLMEYYEQFKKVRQDLENVNYALSNSGDTKEHESRKKENEKELVSINSQLNALEDKNSGLMIFKEKQEEIFSHIQKLKQENDEKESRIEEIKKMIYDLNKEMSASAKDNESIASLNYKIREIEDDLLRYKDTRDAYQLAINSLNESIVKYQKEHISRLSKNISKQYKVITKSKHKKVKLTEDFQPIVEEGTNNNLKNLSAGAEDQLYFAVRLSLLKEINDVSHLPLLLDDPFVNFDQDRLDIVKDVLYKTTKLNQIIIMTHLENYTEWGDVNVIKV